MDSLASLYARQGALAGGISKTVENLYKKGKDKITGSGVTTRINNLEQNWTEFVKHHKQILSLKATEDESFLDAAEEAATDTKPENPYFREALYAVTEEEYLKALTQMLWILEKLPPLVLPQSTAEPASTGAPSGNAIKQLPSLPLPRFAGDYLHWLEFHDAFTSLVASRAHFNNVDRMHYLKSSLDGEAAALIRSFLIEEDNFTRAWNLLKETYENLRLQVDAQLYALFSIKHAANESCEEIRRILHGSMSAIEGMSHLKRPDIAGDLIVHLTASKLDPATRRAWEASLSASKEPATFQELKEFLNGRILMLAAIQASQSAREQRASTAARSHHASTADVAKVPSCPLCSAKHYLWLCDSYRAKPAAERREFIDNKNLCANCLGTNQPADCRSARNCIVCSARHHTSLHEDQSVSANTASIATQQSTTFAANGPLNVLVSDATSFSPVLLPTAVVNIVAADGKEQRVRALIDQGSQCSFIARSLSNELQLPRKPACVPITGIGGLYPTPALGCTNFRIKSCCDPSAVISVDALILTAVTSYTPSAHRPRGGWPHLHGLKLADNYDDESKPIELLLGATVYAEILRDGVRRGSNTTPAAQQTSLGWILSGPIGSARFNANPSDIAQTAHHCFISPPLFTAGGLCGEERFLSSYDESSGMFGQLRLPARL